MKCPSCGAHMRGNTCIYCGYVEYVPSSNRRAAPAKKYQFEIEYNNLAKATIESIKNSRFMISVRGYAIGEVDRFLDELVDKIKYHGNYSMISLPFDYGAIRRVKFTQGFRGYDISQINAFLDRLFDAGMRLNYIKNLYK